MPKRFSLSFLFDSSLQDVLLSKRINATSAGLWNGIGGVIEKGEAPHVAALQKITEETGIRESDIPRFEWLTTMSFLGGVELNVYYGVLSEGISLTQILDDRLTWYPADELHDVSPLYGLEYNGDAAYFVSLALRKLKSGVK